MIVRLLDRCEKMKSALKIDVDVSMNASVESLKDSRLINEISKKVIDILKEKGQKAMK